MKESTFLFATLIGSLLFSCVQPESEGIVVRFPKVNGPIRITNSDKEHFFASYYGINSFDHTERYVTVLETEIKYKLPEVNEDVCLEFSAGMYGTLARKFS